MILSCLVCSCALFVGSWEHLETENEQSEWHAEESVYTNKAFTWWHLHLPLDDSSHLFFFCHGLKLTSKQMNSLHGHLYFKLSRHMWSSSVSDNDPILTETWAWKSSFNVGGKGTYISQDLLTQEVWSHGGDLLPRSHFASNISIKIGSIQSNAYTYNHLQIKARSQEHKHMKPALKERTACLILTNHLNFRVNNVPKKNTNQKTWHTTRDSQNILDSVAVIRLLAAP